MSWLTTPLPCLVAAARGGFTFMVRNLAIRRLLQCQAIQVEAVKDAAVAAARAEVVAEAVVAEVVKDAPVKVLAVAPVRDEPLKDAAWAAVLAPGQAACVSVRNAATRRSIKWEYPVCNNAVRSAML